MQALHIATSEKERNDIAKANDGTSDTTVAWELFEPFVVGLCADAHVRMRASYHSIADCIWSGIRAAAVKRVLSARNARSVP